MKMLVWGYMMFYTDTFVFLHAVRVQTLALVEVFEGAWVDGREVGVVLVILYLYLYLSIIYRGFFEYKY